MSEPTFDFLYNGFSDDYPASSLQLSYGRGYQFASAPRGPDQITTKLNFKSMFTFDDPVTHQLSLTANRPHNIWALAQFYESVRLFGVFLLDHPYRGLTRWRFAKPLSIPEKVDDPGAIGGMNGYRAHQMQPFQVSLILQP